MDVDKTAFYPRLLTILEDISNAHFVSLDFELSGIASKQPGTSRQNQTLQERYAEAKEAAERYRIIQVGLTCVGQSDDAGAEEYVVKTSNFPLNPSLELDVGKELDLERIFSFQSGAVDFLLKNNFDFSQPFARGVSYLSRVEAITAKQNAKDRGDKSRFDDIEIAENDVQTTQFLEKVRSEIKQWRKDGKSDELLIMSRTLHWEKVTTPDLSSFDRRLVHQFVRAEYRDELMTMGRHNCIIIKRVDLHREARYQKDRMKRVKAQIARLTGFRWIIEALTGGSLHEIELSWFAKDPVDGSDIFFDEQDFSARFNRAKAHLKTKRPVLVGHNLLTDLVYLHHSFIGQLPETISEFRICIHDLFPTIVDTKYLATHNCGNINPASSLEQIEETLRTQEIPVIHTHPHHTKYVNKKAFHEAGYDSLLTARVMILLSANLEAAGAYVPEAADIRATSPSDEDYDTAPEEFYDQPLGEGPDGNGPTLISDLNMGRNPTKKKTLNDLKAESQAVVVSPAPKSTKSKKKTNGNRTTSSSRFATGTMFDALVDKESSSERPVQHNKATTNSSHQSKSILNPNAPSFGSPSWVTKRTSDFRVATASQEEKDKENEVQPLMPPFDCDFWRVYANKLRVFGTVERYLDLDPSRAR
ncbi:CAF1-domain-containing protein [Venturia nashicola]|uniref:CAF1-domain-containing protein n=1 Tax=Venturia nashicola TaxID=86259 RepID=A0A4Z1P3F7_9PEZI|nr:CAF1-domain-containing protein [Venturia nashicola]TLD21664.1 CAF1-domain-containing protein [Venturia nashicola]